MDRLAKELEEAVLSGKPSKLEHAADQIDYALIGLRVFPQELLDFLLRLICEAPLLHAEGSNHVLYIFEQNWDILSDSQREALACAIESSFSLAKDWMYCFVASEILGERLSNDEALGILIRLSETQNETARSLVPHGLEHIVRDSGSHQRASQALTRLVDMKHDPSMHVRDEVSDSLRRLSVLGLVDLDKDN